MPVVRWVWMPAEERLPAELERRHQDKDLRLQRDCALHAGFTYACFDMFSVLKLGASGSRVSSVECGFVRHIEDPAMITGLGLVVRRDQPDMYAVLETLRRCTSSDT
jgi:hypothetical protein